MATCMPQAPMDCVSVCKGALEVHSNARACLTGQKPHVATVGSICRGTCQDV